MLAPVGLAQKLGTQHCGVFERPIGPDLWG